MQGLDFRRKRRKSDSRATGRPRRSRRRTVHRGLHFDNGKVPLHFAREKTGVNRLNVRGIVVWAVEILIVCMLAVFLVAAFGQRVSTAGDSMSPALKNGDVLLINRAAYHIKSPARGDIVAFRQEDNGHYSVKRIVGLPGETVQIADGKVLIDGEEMAKDIYVSDIEYAGEAIRSLTMEGRLTLCNLSIEMGARGGMVAPDEVTFAYIKGREYAPKGEAWDKAVAYWKTLKSDDNAVFDKEVRFDAADIEPMITYGTNPGMGMGITQHIPTTEGMGEAAQASFRKSLDYMGFQPGEQLLGKQIDYVFLGACTNGRIEDFRAFASIVKEEGLDKVLAEAGFEIRQPGCSACLAMNDDKVPAGKYAVSTSNRNFEGRQGPGSRTLLASPLTAAAAAVTGVITDPRELL